MINIWKSTMEDQNQYECGNHVHGILLHFNRIVGNYGISILRALFPQFRLFQLFN